MGSGQHGQGGQQNVGILGKRSAHVIGNSDNRLSASFSGRGTGNMRGPVLPDFFRNVNNVLVNAGLRD